MKKFVTSSLLLTLLTSQANALDEPSVSKIFMDGPCQTVLPPAITTSGAESAVLGTLGISLATAIAKEGVSFIASWFKDFKDSYKGADTASGVEYFYCKDDPKEIRQIGVKQQLTYQKNTAGDPNRVEIEFVSSIQVLWDHTKKTPGFFTITPESLNYQMPVARRGKVKDITVVYAFTFIGPDGTEKSVTADPLLLKGITAGTTQKDMGSKYGTKIIIPLPAQLGIYSPKEKEKLWTPFKVSIQFTEVSTGKGEELLGNITKAIGETISSKQDDIAAILLAKLIAKETDGTASDKKQNTKASTTSPVIVQ